MNDMFKTLNDEAWEKLFDKYNILQQIDHNGSFQISAAQIREFREPRIMSKFDHKINLPLIFKKHNLAILPITRGDYIISHFQAYHKFESNASPITIATLPTYIQSLDCNKIYSETTALNCAFASGIIADFVEDEELLSTVTGRMGSGKFDFNIKTKNNNKYRISVNNSQIEIDAAYEGVSNLILFEAKRDISEDFLIRQLYYPFRAWQHRITKPVKTVFLVYSNGIYRLYEYAFEEVNDYNSIRLIKQKNYAVENIEISAPDIQNILHNTAIISEPKIPFPQANSFERIINLCELLNERKLSHPDITERYAFNSRQTNYYTDAAQYLGLLEKSYKNGRTPIYSISSIGKQILNMNYQQRQLAFCRQILAHSVFNVTLNDYFNKGIMPSPAEIIKAMRTERLYKIESESTLFRRSSTVKGWLNWIVGLINE